MDRLISFWEDKEKEFEDLKNENLDIETQLKEYKDRLEHEMWRCRNLCEKNSELETKLDDCESKLINVHTEKCQLSIELMLLKTQCEYVETEKKVLLENKNKELHDLKAKLQDANNGQEMERSAVEELSKALLNIQKQFQQKSAENVVLQQQLDNVTLQHDMKNMVNKHAHVAAKHTTISISQLEEDKKRLKLQVQHLNAQVRMLLNEKNGHRSHFLLNTLRNTDQVSNSSQVVTKITTKGIVEFKDVEELQKRNLKLTAQVKRIKKKYEDKKTEMETMRQEMEDSMRYTLREIQDLQEYNEKEVIDNLKEENLSARQKLSEADAELKNLKQDKGTLDDQVSSLQEEVYHLKADVTKLNMDLATKTRQLKEKDRQIAEQTNTFLRDIESIGRKFKMQSEMGADAQEDEVQDPPQEKRAKMTNDMSTGHQKTPVPSGITDEADEELTTMDGNIGTSTKSCDDDVASTIASSDEPSDILERTPEAGLEQGLATKFKRVTASILDAASTSRRYPARRQRKRPRHLKDYNISKYF